MVEILLKVASNTIAPNLISHGIRVSSHYWPKLYRKI